MPKRAKTIDLTKLSPTCNKISFEINKLDALHLEIETGEVIKSDTKVELFIMKPNNQLVSEIITTISNSTVKIDVKNGALDVAGVAIGRIKLSDSDGIVSTVPFYFAINDSFTNDDAIVNEVGIGAIEELKKQIDDAQIDPEVLKNKIEETINNGGLDLDVASKEEVLILNSQLNTKASKFELEVERKRINNFTRLNEGSTTGDAELTDARIGKDGTIYENTGDAIRSQYELLHSSLDGVKQLAIGVHEINTTSYEGKYLDKTGGWSIDSNLHSKVTDKIVCSPGWVFSYKGKGGTNAASWIMYNGNTLVETGFYDNNKVATEVVIPAGVDSIKFASYNSLSHTVVLDVKLVSNTQVTTDNITSSLKSSIGIYQLDDNLKNIVKYNSIDISDSLKKIDNTYIDYGGFIGNHNSYDCYDLNVSEGEVFSYVGQIIYNLAPYCFYDASDKIVKIGGDGKPHNTDTSVNIDELIIPPGVTKLRVCSGTSDGRANFILNKLTPFAPLVENDINKLIETYKYEGLGDYTDVTGNYELVTGKGYMNNKGNISDTSDTKGQYSQYIPINDFNTIYISAHSIYSTCIMVILDEAKKFLGAKGSASVEGETIWDLKAFNREEILQEYPNAYYIRLGTYEYTKYPLKMYVKKSNIYDIVNNLENTINKSNILHKKKWVACGDSFTEGDFSGYVDENGLSGKNSPKLYDTNRKMYKTYPWWIAERNNMTLINEAKCGSDFTNIEGASNPFSVSRYLAIPTDADYITLMFGLNETGLTTEQIGTKTDTTNTTLWGAYNIVFEHFLTNMPYAKIGVIIADAWMNTRYANAVKEICVYWGIPVLDLKFDTNIPMGIGGRPDGSPKAQQLRDNAFKVTSTNSHPNLEAHKYRSTFIEHWLRSL